MSTRVTSAASKRAKETLIQLLFPKQQAKRYTHLQLRMAYLQKVHIMHPDKQRSTSESSIRDQAAHEKFVELQNAWEAYNLSARMFLQTTNAKSKQGENLDDDGNHDDFIMFGVGCSFSDSPEEKELRNEIMEQACKGWFPSGALSHSDGGEMAKVEVKSYTKLSDDDMFMQHQTSEAFSSTNLHDVQTKKSLVQNVENYRNRRRRNR